jgi:hypothetical protein
MRKIVLLDFLRRLIYNIIKLQHLVNVRFQVLKAASMKMIAFWNIAPYSLVKFYCIPEGYHLHFGNGFVSSPPGKRERTYLLVPLLHLPSDLFQVQGANKCVFVLFIWRQKQNPKHQLLGPCLYVKSNFQTLYYCMLIVWDWSRLATVNT